MNAPVSARDDLFFTFLIDRYVKENPRFLRRDWLAKQLDEKLREPGKRFVLLTAEPGAGKSAFMAQLAHDHPDWPRYFIRRDQRGVLRDVSARSLLLRIGYQLAAQRPDLFTKEQLTLSVKIRLGEVDKGGEAVGVEIDKLIQSPFYRNLGIDVDQQAEHIRGKLVAMRIGELYIEERLLLTPDLLHLALIDPARTLMRLDPGKQIVLLIDALDEISYQKEPGDILAWLTKCPELPENIRFVLTSRPPDQTLRLFCNGEVARLSQLAIGENDPQVQADIEQFVTKWTDESGVAHAINQAGGNPEDFATNATGKAHGNLGYVDALARGIDRAIADMDGIKEASRERGRTTLEALLSLKELPEDQNGLYAFFLNQIRKSVARERIEQTDPQTGETYDKAVWPAVYHKILGVLAVALEPLDLDLIESLSGIQVDRVWVSGAIDRLTQFLDVIGGRYRLYHATVAEFLTTSKTRTNPDTTALYQDSAMRHRQIADHYWQYRNDWTKCDNYGLRNLATHLDVAGKVERLHQLITNEWMRARVTSDGYRYSGFVSDVMRAWERARMEAIRQIETNDAEFTAYATCFRYALILTSINSLSSNYPVPLVTRALETKAWSVERALDVCMYAVEPARRAELYLAALHADKVTLSVAQRRSAEQAALAAAQAITHHETRARALIVVAEQLCAPQKTTALDAALATIKQLDHEQERVEGLRLLAPLLSGAQVDEALAAARAIEDKGTRAQALLALAPQLSGGQRTEVLAEALAAARAIEFVRDRFSVLTALAEQMSGVQRTTVLEAALAAARGMKRDRGLVEALAVVAPQFGEGQRAEVLDEALAAARAIEDKGTRAQALLALAPQLSGGQRTEVLAETLAAARAIEFVRDRFSVLTALAEQMSGVQRTTVLEAALAAARGMKRDRGLVEALAVVAPQLSEGQRAEVLDEALAAAQAIRHHERRSRALIAVAEQLSEVQKATVLNAALATIKQLDHEQERVEGLCLLAPLLNGSQMETAFRAARAIGQEDLAHALTELAPLLSGSQVKAAFAAAQTIVYWDFRIGALKALARLFVSADVISPQITELRSPLNTESQCPFTTHHDGGGTDAAKGGLHDDSHVSPARALSL